MRNIRQNLFWHSPIIRRDSDRGCGFARSWVAGAAMAMSSVSVVTNALRLQRMKIGNRAVRREEVS